MTTLNPNVMFEIGYGIGRNKRVWGLLDTSRTQAKKDFERLKLLTTIGYVSYRNSHDIVSSFYRDEPQHNLQNTLLSQLLTTARATDEDLLFYLKARHDNEAQIQLSRAIEEASGRVVIDDPAESTPQSLDWYARHLYAAAGVVCHLTHPSREDSTVHNAKQSLVASFAYALSKPLLMLAEDDFLAPLDYRDLLTNYPTAAVAVSAFRQWFGPIASELRRLQQLRLETKSQLRLAIELQSLRLGEHIAENERTALLEGYFVETPAYRELLHGQHRVFVGRKGAGKTALLLSSEQEL